LVVRGYAQSEHVSWCDALFAPVRITFPVLECNRYINATMPAVEAMEEIAWDLARQKTARAGIRAEEVDPQRAIGMPLRWPKNRRTEMCRRLKPTR
jgi:hypothetical protein